MTNVYLSFLRNFTILISYSYMFNKSSAKYGTFIWHLAEIKDIRHMHPAQ